MIPTATVVSGKATPRGRFSHIERAGDFLFVSGTSSRRPDNSFEGVCVDAMGTTTSIFGSKLAWSFRTSPTFCAPRMQSCAISSEVTVFLVNMNDFKGYNEVYAEYFDFKGPTRTTVAVRQLPHPHLLIEMRGIAYKPVPQATTRQPRGVNHVQIACLQFPEMDPRPPP